MHIALYSPSWPPGNTANGIVTYVSEMRSWLLSAGHSVTVFSGHCAYSDLQEWTLPRSSPLERATDRLFPQSSYPRVLAKLLRYVHGHRPIEILDMEETFGWSRYVQSRVPFPVVTRLHGPHFLAEPKGRTRREARAWRARVRGGWNPVISTCL
jgi:hypothetical protein